MKQAGLLVRLTDEEANLVVGLVHAILWVVQLLRPVQLVDFVCVLEDLLSRIRDHIPESLCVNSLQLITTIYDLRVIERGWHDVLLFLQSAR